MNPTATAILHKIIVEEDALQKTYNGKVPVSVIIQPQKKHAYISRLVKSNYQVSLQDFSHIINTIIAAK